jgi:DNA repair protein RecN (Recombination protein N)
MLSPQLSGRALLFIAGCLFLQASLARDVPFVPTPEPVVERMLEIAKVGPQDVVYDLGSGDGRIVITAAKKYGARGVGIDIDPERKAYVETRIGTAHQLARKHRIDPPELPALLARLRDELDALDHAAARLGELAAERDALAARYRDRSAALSKARAATAKALGKAVTGAMQGLGMDGGRFTIEVAHDAARFSAAGGDAVEFLVSANKGMPPRPLAKVASGGELSRISLALQVTAAHDATIACLVFDEVDAGIGGAVAEIVGRQLAVLAERRQVLCVTHLPQVASQGRNHLKVEKRRAGGGTRATVAALARDERVDELARMLGGVQVTDKTRAAAREMLASAD